MTRGVSILLAAASIGFFAADAVGEAIHYDVFLTSTGIGSKLLVGGYDDAAAAAIVPQGQMRVFGGHVVGSGASLPFESEAPGEPGFRAGNQSFLDGAQTTPSGVYTALSGSTAVSFAFQPIAVGAATRNLFFWDGSGAVNFTPAGVNVILGLTKQGASGWTASVDGGTAAVTAGNTIQNTSSSGFVHTHLFTSLSAGGAAPDQGFYLFALQLGMAGYTPSDPIYFVVGALDPNGLAAQFADLTAFEAAHGLAESWVDANLVAVPEPSACLIAASGAVCGALAALRRRCRRRMTAS